MVFGWLDLITASQNSTCVYCVILCIEPLCLDRDIDNHLTKCMFSVPKPTFPLQKNINLKVFKTFSAFFVTLLLHVSIFAKMFSLFELSLPPETQTETDSLMRVQV